jgi:transcriptional regulator with PAS, ATPase and Fis domain
VSGDHAAQDCGSTCVALVCERQPSRLQTVCRVVAECGARLSSAENFPEIEESKTPASRIILVALDECPEAGTPVLSHIRAIKQQGLTVICYGDGVRFWPLGKRCQLLLAGALDLLDSDRTEFPQELSRILTQLVCAETSRRTEDEKIKREMKRLGVVGESREMLSAFRWVVRIAVLSDLPTVVTGETGTGKEVLVNAIHQLDQKRCQGPFVALNCSAINPNLAESELFGHRRGAFTGADRERKGLIRSAEGGVLFLDEIGDLDGALQAKLLRVLQENRVLGVGDDREVAVSVRIVAATNRDLGEMVRQGKFREDLFHRLNSLSVYIPPLRQRTEDIKPLVEHFLNKYQPLGRVESLLAVSPEFIEALKLMKLPGNARQLENLIARVVGNRETNEPLGLLDLPDDAWREIADGEAHAQAPGEAESCGTKSPAPDDLHAQLTRVLDLNNWNLARSLEYCERLLLEAAITRTHGNQTQTARLLGITARSVYNKLRKHNLH